MHELITKLYQLALSSHIVSTLLEPRAHRYLSFTHHDLTTRHDYPDYPTPNTSNTE